MIQLNRIQLTSQTRNHVEMNKILSTSHWKVELLTANVCLEYALSETHKTYSYKIRFSPRL